MPGRNQRNMRTEGRKSWLQACGFSSFSSKLPPQGKRGQDFLLSLLMIIRARESPADLPAKQSKKSGCKGRISSQPGFLYRIFPLAAEIKIIRGENLVLSSLATPIMIITRESRQITTKKPGGFCPPGLQATPTLSSKQVYPRCPTALCSRPALRR